MPSPPSSTSAAAARGQTAVEWLGAAVAVAVLALALIAAVPGVGREVGERLGCIVATVGGGSACATTDGEALASAPTRLMPQDGTPGDLAQGVTGPTTDRPDLGTGTANATQTVGDGLPATAFADIRRDLDAIARGEVADPGRERVRLRFEYFKARGQLTGGGEGPPPPRRPVGVWRVGLDGRTTQVDPATDAEAAEMLARVERVLDGLWSRYGQNGCDGRGSAPEIVLRSQDPALARTSSYLSEQPGQSAAQVDALRELAGVGTVPLNHGVLTIIAPHDGEAVLAHELTHCLTGSRTLHPVVPGVLLASPTLGDPGIAEGLADVGAYNYAYDIQALPNIPDRKLYPEPLPRADVFACQPDGHLRGQLIVAAYGEIVKAFDPLPDSLHANAQKLFYQAVEQQLTSSTTLADVRGVFVDAARELWPPELVSGTAVSVVGHAFDAVGLTAGWQQPNCSPLAALRP